MSRRYVTFLLSAVVLLAGLCVAAVGAQVKSSQPPPAPAPKSRSAFDRNRATDEAEVRYQVLLAELRCEGAANAYAGVDTKEGVRDLPETLFRRIATALPQVRKVSELPGKRPRSPYKIIALREVTWHGRSKAEAFTAYYSPGGDYSGRRYSAVRTRDGWKAQLRTIGCGSWKTLNVCGVEF